MFGLDTGLTILLLLCLFAACAFEFINGFHDTANAVATVIYTHSLKPRIAVIWSGVWNFIGVHFGGIAVAMGIVNLLPAEALVDNSISNGISMIMALIFTAIIWNIGTWYYGIPVSSSHTLIGSIFGVGLAFMFLPGSEGVALNWKKAEDVGLSLLISPVFGFFAALFLMFVLRRIVKNQKLFKEPDMHKAPPIWVRPVMIFTCTAVSFSHGSNDGQKGVGLMMMILIAIVPGYFAVNTAKSPEKIVDDAKQIKVSLLKADTSKMDLSARKKLFEINGRINTLKTILNNSSAFSEIPRDKHFEVRKNIILITKTSGKLISSLPSGENIFPDHELSALKKNIASIKTNIEFAPWWVILLISLSLGTGTMIGWKRIVITIGEKIGKTHLNYAQGASAEVVAASTIAVSTYLGMPVSTTQVLSSGIAGTMVAGSGLKNLQKSTVRNIAIAWLITLPVTIVLSGSLFLLLRYIFD